MLKIIVTIALASMMLQTGLQVDRERLKSIFMNRALIGRALLANVVLVPLFGFLAVRAFSMDDAIETGVLLMAVSPGLPLLPRRAGPRIGGSLNFAVALAFLLPLVSVITVPLTLPLVLPAGYAAHLPLRQFLTTLILAEFIPLAAGLVIAHAWPALAKALLLPLSVVFTAAIVVFVVLAGPAVYRAIASAYGSFALLASLCIVLLSFATGMLLGGRDPAYRNTLAMGTALRNFGLAALIATIEFPRTPVVAAVISYFFVQLVVAMALGAYLKRGVPAQIAG